jgi:hypothetical protein
MDSFTHTLVRSLYAIFGILQRLRMSAHAREPKTSKPAIGPVSTAVETPGAGRRGGRESIASA